MSKGFAKFILVAAIIAVAFFVIAEIDPGLANDIVNFFTGGGK